MKACILIILLTISALPVLCQSDSSLIKEIDSRISVFEHSLVVDTILVTDSSRLNRFAYTETYFKNTNNNQLGKVEKYFGRTNIRIILFFDNNKLLKSKIINNSNNVSRIANLYFSDDLLIYSSPKSIDGDSSGEIFLSKAKEYLSNFALMNKK
jgi:hypothetical protein